MAISMSLCEVWVLQEKERERERERGHTDQKNTQCCFGSFTTAVTTAATTAVSILLSGSVWCQRNKNKEKKK